MIDQASKLREIINNDIENLKLNNIYSIVSGKGGVGKTYLAIELNKKLNNSVIIDCDFNSLYYCYVKNVNYIVGYKYLNNNVALENMKELNNNIKNYNYIFVDAGTGLNAINNFYFSISKEIILVADTDEITILNTFNLIKKINKKNFILYINDKNNKNLKNIKESLSKYNNFYLKDKMIKVIDSLDELLNMIKVHQDFKVRAMRYSNV